MHVVVAVIIVYFIAEACASLKHPWSQKDAQKPPTHGGDIIKETYQYNVGNIEAKQNECPAKRYDDWNGCMRLQGPQRTLTGTSRQASRNFEKKYNTPQQHDPNQDNTATTPKQSPRLSFIFIARTFLCP